MSTHGQPLAALIVLAALSALPGCAEYSAGSAAVRAEGKLAAAEALDAALWTQCRALPVGAIVERFGRNEADWAAYGRICLGFWQASVPPMPVGK